MERLAAGHHCPALVHVSMIHSAGPEDKKPGKDFALRWHSELEVRRRKKMKIQNQGQLQSPFLRQSEEIKSTENSQNKSLAKNQAETLGPATSKNSLSADSVVGKVREMNLHGQLVRTDLEKKNLTGIVQPSDKFAGGVEPVDSPKAGVAPEDSPRAVVAPEDSPRTIVQPQDSPRAIIQPQDSIKSIVEPQDRS